MSEDCHCEFDGEQRACIGGRVYGPCDHPDCGGVCEMERDCDCACHRRDQRVSSASVGVGRGAMGG